MRSWVAASLYRAFCRARDLAVRRDADGRAIYVVGSGAEYVEVDGVQLEIEPAGSVEWKRGAP